MSELKLEVGKRYNIVTYKYNGDVDKDHILIGELIHITKLGKIIFENDDGELIIIEDESDVLSEYTEPEKLSGFIHLYRKGDEIIPRYTNCDCVPVGVTSSIKIAKIPLSQFNVGEGL